MTQNTRWIDLKNQEMVPWGANELEKKEELIEKILDNEKPKKFNSERTLDIVNNIRDFLQKTQTDLALLEISMWALELWSSDLHMDNEENETILRFRIDWVLQDIMSFNKKEYKLLLERFKYNSSLKLNITDTPQDWKYKSELNWKTLDVRISTLPTQYWENIVCRILDSSKNILDLKDLGFYWSTERIVKKAINKKNWLILVTWPTWSWKTSTLYTILNKLNTREKKITTLEDPIEYSLPWIVQSEINEKKWYTFPVWLKALLRQDPDVIMLWEIRDAETLNTATSASLTWHLVLSTLHTKSAADTLDRLINMWMKPYILASAVDTIIAQRLVRKICDNCKEEVEKTNDEKQLINSMLEETWMKSVSQDPIKLYHWKWCDKCNHSWYKGRIWVYEIINMWEKIKNIIRDWGTTEEIIEQARKNDMITMQEDWILKALKWYTTIEEVLRII